MSLRIISGHARGRKIEAPSTSLTRPTSDKVRGAIFSILASRLAKEGRTFEDSHVLDVFAGSGAMGLEAFSRGAKKGAFIEQNPEAFRTLLHNISHLGADGDWHAYRRDACDPGKPHGAFDLVFLDPPYGKNLIPRAVRALARAGWFAQNALLVVEVGAQETPPTLSGFDCLDTRVLGPCHILLFARTQEQNEVGEEETGDHGGDL